MGTYSIGIYELGISIAILTDEKAHGHFDGAVRLNMLPGWTMGCKDYSI